MIFYYKNYLVKKLGRILEGTFIKRKFPTFWNKSEVCLTACTCDSKRLFPVLTARLLYRLVYENIGAVIIASCEYPNSPLQGDTNVVSLSLEQCQHSPTTSSCCAHIILSSWASFLPERLAGNLLLAYRVLHADIHIVVHSRDAINYILLTI